MPAKYRMGSTTCEWECRAAALQVNDLLRQINADLLHSSQGAAGLTEKLLRMDADGSGSVCVEEVILAFSFVGLQLARADADLLQKQFATPQTGMMDVRALLTQLKMLAPNESG